MSSSSSSSSSMEEEITSSSSSSDVQGASRKSKPWVEKYRPKTITDVVDQDEIVATLKSAIESSNLPHLLFYGPAGVGKTSTILAAARDMYGPELFESRVKELNASDERGISTVRDTINYFASTAVGHEKADGYPSPPYKLIILDEADSMTASAQDAMRRSMETHSKVTRFCLVCNYVSRITDPLASRCVKFRFKPLARAQQVERLKTICQQEDLSLEDDVLETMVDLSEGDMRRAVTLLQSCTNLYGSEVSSDDVIELAGVLPADRVTALLDAASTGSFSKTQEQVEDIIADGYSAQLVIAHLHDAVIEADNLDDLQKSAIAMALAKADGVLNDGADEELQLLDVAAKLTQVFASA